jgi:hypothetical protein
VCNLLVEYAPTSTLILFIQILYPSHMDMSVMSFVAC